MAYKNFTIKEVFYYFSLVAWNSGIAYREREGIWFGPFHRGNRVHGRYKGWRRVSSLGCERQNKTLDRLFGNFLLLHSSREEFWIDQLHN